MIIGGILRSINVERRELQNVTLSQSDSVSLAFFPLLQAAGPGYCFSWFIFGQI